SRLSRRPPPFSALFPYTTLFRSRGCRLASRIPSREECDRRHPLLHRLRHTRRPEDEPGTRLRVEALVPREWRLPDHASEVYRSARVQLIDPVMSDVCIRDIWQDRWRRTSVVRY